MRNILYVAVVGLVFGIACQPTPKQSTQDDTTTSNPSSSVQDTIIPTHPSISQEVMDMLWDKCTSIDYIFYSLPYSISTSSNAESRPLLRHISNTPAQVLPNCPAIATIMYIGNGEKLLQASLHLSASPCSYVVFYENDKPKYANYLTPEGMGYMKQLFNSVQIQNQ